MTGEKQSKVDQKPDRDTLKITEQTEGIPGVNTPRDPHGSGRPPDKEQTTQ